MKIVAVTQARTSSTRLPAKILKKIGNDTLLELHLKRILKSKKIDQLVVATTTNPEDAAIADIATSLGLEYYRGDVNDVLDRFYRAVETKGADYIVRLTSDCPLIDAELIDKVIQKAIDEKLDYCSNVLEPTYPDGQDVEVFRFAALKKAWTEAAKQSEREHVTPYIWGNSTYKGGTLFQSGNFSEGYTFEGLRMTIDEQRDFDLIEQLILRVGTEQPWLMYANFLEKNDDIRNINQTITRNEGYTKSINNES
ncbi:glycosyltransferase family protein [Dawidia soli]|uniref:Glycosyltransferase family protein n=1 Tax=Dawidia soli TaxID=2782352 RepID=A0AAP2GG57_9BACT|nr:glycosyltransferase family protein [Dawidia soli]MBT1690199.1 glycosyltransferase family protein [Dawidia soli]